MEQEKIAVGLDIGTTKIVAMVGKKNKEGQLEILGVGKTKSEGVNRGVVINVNQTTKSIKEVMQQVGNLSGLDIKEVVVGIAGQHIQSQQVADYISLENHDETITRQNVEELIKKVHSVPLETGKEIIHVLPQDYKVDNEKVTEPVGMYGRRLDANFHIVKGDTTSIKTITKSVKEAGLNFLDITLEPLASAEAVLSEEEKEAGVVLVDIGGGTTDLAIFKDGIIRHTAVIPFGGNSITNDIKEACAIIASQAESLKVKFGTALTQKDDDKSLVSIPGFRGQKPTEVSLNKLSNIIYSRLKEIFGQVLSQIKSYTGEGDSRKKLIAGVVLTGGGAQLKYIKQAVEYFTTLNVRVGSPNENIKVDAMQKELNEPTYATVVGLMMIGLKKKNQSELQKNEETTNEPVEHQNEELVVEEQNKKTKSLSFIERWAQKITTMMDKME